MDLHIKPLVDEWDVAKSFITNDLTSEGYKYQSAYGVVELAIVERPDEKIHVAFKIPTYSTRIYEAVFKSSDLAVLNTKQRMQGIQNADNVVEFLENDQLFS